MTVLAAIIAVVCIIAIVIFITAANTDNGYETKGRDDER